MEYLNKGKYYGIPQKVIHYNGMIITDNEYVQSRVDWHYHENAYFTYLLKGNLIETSKSETYNCSPGTLLYHNRQEAHFNIKPPGYTRGFQVELSKDWFTRHNLNLENLEGSTILTNPGFKDLFNRIYNESVISDTVSNISIEGLLLQVFGLMLRNSYPTENSIPFWLKKIESILTEEYSSKITLEFLSGETGIHPVHISRMFPKYFKSTIGSYIRKVKVNKAIELISGSNHTLTEISGICGFSDQSHFIRVFKSQHGITPSQYIKNIKKS